MGKQNGPPPRKRPDDDAALVDRLLKQLPHADPSLSNDEPAKPVAPAPRAAASRPSPPRPKAPVRNVRGAWWRVLVGVAFAAAIPFWPYFKGCGFPLAGYLCIVIALLVVGLWGARFSWQERVAAAHIVALLVILWAGVLGAERVLPRVRYARSEATWMCSVEPAVADAPVPTAAPLVVSDTTPVDSASATAESGTAGAEPDSTAVEPDTTAGGAAAAR